METPDVTGANEANEATEVAEVAEVEVVVRNPQGMHLRPATEFARLVLSTGCAVRVYAGDADANGASVLELAMLGIVQGTPLRIAVEGVGAVAAARSLAQLVTDGFSESGH